MPILQSFLLPPNRPFRGALLCSPRDLGFCAKNRGREPLPPSLHIFCVSPLFLRGTTVYYLILRPFTEEEGEKLFSSPPPGGGEGEKACQKTITIFLLLFSYGLRTQQAVVALRGRAKGNISFFSTLSFFETVTPTPQSDVPTPQTNRMTRCMLRPQDLSEQTALFFDNHNPRKFFSWCKNEEELFKLQVVKSLHTSLRAFFSSLAVKSTKVFFLPPLQPSGGD